MRKAKEKMLYGRYLKRQERREEFQASHLCSLGCLIPPSQPFKASLPRGRFVTSRRHAAWTGLTRGCRLAKMASSQTAPRSTPTLPTRTALMDKQQKHATPLVFTQPTHIIAPSLSLYLYLSLSLSLSLSLCLSLRLSPRLNLSVHLPLTHDQAEGEKQRTQTKRRPHRWEDASGKKTNIWCVKSRGEDYLLKIKIY